MFQEYPLLSFRPLNVTIQDTNLRFLAVRYGVEVVQQGSDLYIDQIQHRRIGADPEGDALVFVFAVEDMNARESVITSVRPCAFL